MGVIGPWQVDKVPSSAAANRINTFDDSLKRHRSIDNKQKNSIQTYSLVIVSGGEYNSGSICEKSKEPILSFKALYWSRFLLQIT